ncbi:MAG: NapC/NirT family cytochrome c [Caldilineaceae bacterium]|nr:NapC/NirT family cytochrome c [Caldilineaceae bacterium]MBP8107584.1 NapC/NirT family cytochrome c [Caldilineaceae bacterium]MBP8123807.1 NapC/NirT family cytochrome c [Caldilineaceae bacterium]MBP9071349.1 NapC/NirT family cytochrome c [Caldilineaceae bacterium]
MWDKINRFITPERSSPLWMRLMPFAALVFAGLTMFLVGGAGWEYTNRSQFCGESCHTMPPQYESWQVSSHSRVNCVDCHIGRAYIATQFSRKAQDISHVIEFIGAHYEVPIYSKKLRPATEACEKCHSPQKFSDDSLREFKTYSAERNNELTTMYMAFKTGGGTQREGSGKGIHWHIENQVEYIATDSVHLEQEIPWVRVTDAATGEIDVYTDVSVDLPADFAEQNQGNIKVMDCITCHNRDSHPFDSPDAALDDALSRGLVDVTIPYIKKNALAVMERGYPNIDEARSAIWGLKGYYQANWPDYYADYQTTVDASVDQLAALYEGMVYPNMDVSWKTHPNNVGHLESAGCFRCHDGKHLNAEAESVRIECNLCHTIPVQNRPDGTMPDLTVETAFEPDTHIDSNWISRHRFEFDSTCEGCHSVENPGGKDNVSFCANAGCHATEWTFAGLNAPSITDLTNVLDELLPSYPESPLTWDDLVGPILHTRCASCHGGTAGLYLDTYEDLLAGGNFGAAVVPGDADASLLIQLQKEGHPNRLAPRELEWIEKWINEGIPRS